MQFLILRTNVTVNGLQIFKRIEHGRSVQYALLSPMTKETWLRCVKNV
jgi:hypothetical protein